jgi:hypothetical protein
MSYDIYIGNAEIETPDREPDYLYGFDVRVRHVQIPGAPTAPNDDMTGNGNSRHPGYIQWPNFAEEVGLHAFFFDKSTGLMHEHPGCFPLYPEHLYTVRAALAAYKARWPEAVPGFTGLAFGRPTPEYPEEVEERLTANANLARLIWLEFWIAWALETCERPAIENH